MDVLVIRLVLVIQSTRVAHVGTKFGGQIVAQLGDLDRFLLLVDNFVLFLSVGAIYVMPGKGIMSSEGKTCCHNIGRGPRDCVPELQTPCLRDAGFPLQLLVDRFLGAKTTGRSTSARILWRARTTCPLNPSPPSLHLLMI